MTEDKYEKAIRLLADGKVAEIRPEEIYRSYRVEGATGKHLVELRMSCDCEAGANTVLCSHIIACILQMTTRSLKKP